MWEAQIFLQSKVNNLINERQDDKTYVLQVTSVCMSHDATV
jgi:hypothetical protein